MGDSIRTIESTAYPPLTYNYKTYLIDPASPNFNFLAGKYSALSALALTTDPESFGIAYTTEATFTSADCIKRLSRPNVRVFVCVAHPSVLPGHSLTIENGAWVGMVTQIGPTPKSVYELPESGAEPPLDDNQETHWHQTATWIDPAHRGRGLALQIINAGVAYAAATIGGSVQQVRMRAIIGPDNNVSRSLYGKLGFAQTGKCTIPEGMRANGNEGFPFHGRTDWGDELMKSREGVVLERVVRKADLE